MAWNSHPRSRGTAAHDAWNTQAWFRICHFWVTRTCKELRPVRAGLRPEGCPVREAASLLRPSPLRLKRSQAQQGEPVRMPLAGHQLPRALALALNVPATHKAAVVQEEPQQVQVRAAEVTAQGEVGAQPRVEVLYERAAARRVGHGPAHGLEQAVVLAPYPRSQPVPPLPVRG